MADKSARKRYAAEYKFSKLTELNTQQDIGGAIGMAARREKKRMADTWAKRTSSNTKGFHNKAALRAVKRGEL